jgi:hypothetical protein
MTGIATLNANSDRPRVAASSNARARAASQPIRTMPKIGAMISRMAAMAARPAAGRLWSGC